MKTKWMLKLAILPVIAALGLSACSTLSSPDSTPHHLRARSAYIVEPANGAVVATTFKVVFGAKGIKVSPAAPDGPIDDNNGHHHLLINLAAPKLGEGIPFSDGYMHFGKAQTEAMVTLKPGEYTLTAQMANGAHQSFGPSMAHTIRVTVR